MLKAGSNPKSLEMEREVLAAWAARDAAPRVLAGLIDGILILEWVPNEGSMVGKTNLFPQALELLAELAETPVASSSEVTPLTTYVTNRLAMTRRRIQAVSHMLTSQQVELANNICGLPLPQPCATHPDVYVHSDLHPNNILCGPNGLILIDPRGSVGDPCYDAAVLTVRGPSGPHGIQATMFDTFSRQAELAGFNLETVTRWARYLTVDMAVGHCLTYGRGDAKQHLVLADRLHRILADS